MARLSDQDVKTLQTFSMYIQSYGSKVVRTHIEVSYDGDVYFEIYGWDGDGSRMTIPSYDAIDELIERIITEENIVGNYFNDENRGNIVPIINANDKSLTFSADVYIQNEDPVGGTIEGEDIPEFVLTWMREMRESESYKSGSIHYEGSGDSGYMESDMIVNGEDGVGYPSNIEDWLTNRVTDYGDWYNNEGGHGDIYIDFVNETINIVGGLYFEDEDILKVDYYGSFK